MGKHLPAHRSAATTRSKAQSKIRALTANTCGLDKAKWAKLEKMADTNKLDMIMMQECSDAKAAFKFVDLEKWHFFHQSEEPTFAQRQCDGETAVPQVGNSRFYATAIRRENTDLTAQSAPYLPGANQEVQKAIFGDKPRQQVTRTGRVTKRTYNRSRLDALGQRHPQKIVLRHAAGGSIVLFNNHAPQGGGSSKGFSGMDAAAGHDILSKVADAEPNSAIVGDQNAEKRTLKMIYRQKKIISAGRKDPLTHVIASASLEATPIDLIDNAGEEFNNKGQPGSSDHSAMAFELTFPKLLF